MPFGGYAGSLALRCVVSLRLSLAISLPFVFGCRSRQQRNCTVVCNDYQYCTVTSATVIITIYRYRLPKRIRKRLANPDLRDKTFRCDM